MLSSKAQPSDADNQVTCPRCNLAFAPDQPRPEDSPDTAAPPRSGTLVMAPGQLLAAAAASSPTPPAMPSHVGRFEIRRFVGEGAFGRVYEAYDPSLKRLVALKVARPEQLLSDNRIRRFQREAQNAALLLHPHIVAVFDSGQDGGQHYIASVFIKGQPLDAVLESLPEGQTLPLRDLVQLVRKLAEALAYAHKQGVIHRDLKPGNVMVRSDGEPLVMDFGLATRSDEIEKLTQDGSIMGTPPYMAPEQWRGQAEPASDQYSLGCLLFELLTGRLAFVGSSTAHYMHLHFTEPAPSPRQVRPGVPRDLDTICRKCLEKEPAQRYRDCQGLAEDLGRFLDGEPVSVRPAGPRERLLKWARRNPVVAGLTAAVALTLLLGATAASYFAVRADHEASQARTDRNRADEEAGKARAEKTRAEEQRDRAEMSAYVNRITLAQVEWEHGSAAVAWKHLEACPLNLRGWEHNYLVTRFNKTSTFRGHTSLVASVAFSADGKRIVSGSWDKTVKVWDADKGTEIRTLKGHIDAVNSVAFSADGKRIISGSWDNTVKVWDADKGLQTRTLKGHTREVTSVAISGDGKRIVSASYDKTLKVWDADKGTEILSLKGHTREVDSVALSADGKRIVSGSWDKTVKVWDTDKGAEILTLKGHTLEVFSVAFSADGKRIVSGSRDKTVKVWDADKGTEILTLKGRTAALSVAFSPDGKRIVSASGDDTVKVWDVGLSTETLTLKGHTDYVLSAAFSADGKHIVSGGRDQTVKVWDADRGTETLTLKGHTDTVSSVVLSPDGKRIVSASYDKTLKVWDADKGTETLSLKGHSGAVDSVAFSADGKFLVSGSGGFDGQGTPLPGEVKVWNAAKGTETLTFKGHTSWVLSVAIRADGKRIVSGSYDGTVKVWDADKGTATRTLKGHTAEVESVALSADGKRIVSGSRDGTVKVWDADKGIETLTFKGHPHWVSSVAISADGKHIVSGDTDGTVKIWDADKGTETFSLKGHTGGVNSVAISADGKRIVSGSGDSTVKIWDTEKGIETLSLKGHTGTVTGVAISADGQRIVSGSWDKTVKVWDADKGLPRGP